MCRQKFHGGVTCPAHLPLGVEAEGVPVAGVLVLGVQGQPRLQAGHRARAGTDAQLGSREDGLGARAGDVRHAGRHVCVQAHE